MDRRPKSGFGVPVDAWFRGELKGYVHDMLLSPQARHRDYLDPKVVRATVDRHTAVRANEGQRLWALITFERWLQLLPSFLRGTMPPTTT